METRILVTIVLVSLLLTTISNESRADETRDLRLYKVNKDGIASRFWFTRGKAKNKGCQNLTKKARLHSAVQFGYPSCQIYTQKNCATNSLLSFTHKDVAEPTTELTQGYRWYAVTEHPRGIRVKSWRCGGE